MWDDHEKLIKVLTSGGIAVMPTDTLYGIVGQALNASTVNRIYEARKRAPGKPCIILIGDISELNKFSIVLSESQKNTLEKYWFASSGVEGSNPTSIVLDCDDDAFTYLHRGTKTLAFRLPAQKDLQNLLLKTGPLIAPSANLEGLPPARNISEARGYFGDLVDPVRGREGSQQPSTSNGVDLYVDGGEITSKASRVIRLNKDCSVEVLRD